MLRMVEQRGLRNLGTWSPCRATTPILTGLSCDFLKKYDKEVKLTLEVKLLLFLTCAASSLNTLLKVLNIYYIEQVLGIGDKVIYKLDAVPDLTEPVV